MQLQKVRAGGQSRSPCPANALQTELQSSSAVDGSNCAAPPNQFPAHLPTGSRSIHFLERNTYMQFLKLDHI